MHSARPVRKQDRRALQSLLPLQSDRRGDKDMHESGGTPRGAAPTSVGRSEVGASDSSRVPTAPLHCHVKLSSAAACTASQGVSPSTEHARFWTSRDGFSEC